MNGLRRILSVSFALMSVLTWVFPLSAEYVSVRASRGNDFGRIVFLWDRPVSHKMAHNGRTITIRFGRPIEASYQRVLGALRKYIDRVRTNRDGRSVTFELTGAYEAFGFDSGNAVIVEIAELPDQEPQLQPQPEAGEVSTRTVARKFAAQAVVREGLPKIRVRTGRHPNYSRIVIDWPEKVDYKFDQKDGVVAIRFGNAADLQLAGLKRSPPPYVGAVRARPGAEETFLELAVAQSSDVRHFLSGSKLVLDVGRPNGSGELAALPEALPPSATTPNVSVKTEPKSIADGRSPAQSAMEKQTPSTPSQPEPTKERASAPEASNSIAAPVAAASSEPEPPSSQLSSSREVSPRAVQSSSKPIVLRPVAVSAAQPVASDVKPPASKEGEPADPNVEGAEPPPTPSVKTGVKFTFDWEEPVAAAVFRRAGYLWLIFDKPARIDGQSLLQSSGGVIKSIDQAPMPDATVLRMRVSRRINPTLSRDGLSWIIELSKRETTISNPIEVKAQPDSPVGARIFLPVLEPGRPVGITDPAVGDNLVVVPVIPLGHGLHKTYTYSQLRVLPSSQGIVIKPLVDDLRVRPLRQGIELTSGAKLALSPVSADVAARAKLAATKPLTKILELDKWEVTSIEQFNKEKQNLQDEVAAAQGEQRILERYKLARSYFANRFAPETLGVLAALKREEPEIENEPEFRLIRGGASYLMGRLPDAASDFTHGSLDGSDEANFWRAAVVAESGDLLAAAPTLTRAGVVTKKYPKPLKLQMGTLVADAAVEIGDIQTAKTYIKAMKKLEPSEAQLAAIEFVEGRMLNLDGDTDGAISLWEGVQEKRNKWIRARATIARVELLLKLDRMKPMEAIKQLENLRFAWRGDNFEFALLRRLGGLYLDEGIYRNGLQALRQAVTYFRNNEESPQVTQQMADVFNVLYLEDGADQMSAVQAIAIFEEFKELAPAGAKGDEMIRKLADRLAGVDLLDQAAAILEDQIQSRVSGVLKSEVGARLAIVYLLARRYDRALTALDATNVRNLPSALGMQRRHLRARSLMGLNQSETALEVLKRDKTIDAELLRAELFWNGGDWHNASKALRKILRASGAKRNEPVNPEQAQKVLNYAIALALSENERALAKVRQDYGPAVQVTEFKDAFRLVAAPTALGLISPNSVPSRVKLAENFKTFLSEYKKRLQESGLSGIISQEAAVAGAKEQPEI